MAQAELGDLDSARLQRSHAYFVQQYRTERDPRTSGGTLDGRALFGAVADFVEETQDFCAERVAEIDRDLRKRDAYPLSFLREYLARPWSENVK
jgi:hypothetical protein